MHHLWALGSLRRFLSLSPIFWEAFLSGVTTLENFCKENIKTSHSISKCKTNAAAAPLNFYTILKSSVEEGWNGSHFLLWIPFMSRFNIDPVSALC